jgi:hypothetical protein
VDIEEDVNHRIQVGLMKWRDVLGVICNRKVPLKLDRKISYTPIRPTILYDTEC